MKPTTKAQARYAKRIVNRAVREAERNGHPLDVQKILWRMMAEEARQANR